MTDAEKLSEINGMVGAWEIIAKDMMGTANGHPVTENLAAQLAKCARLLGEVLDK